MKIRDAVFEDFEVLLPMAVEAHARTVFARWPMNEAAVQRQFVIMMAFDNGYARVVEHKGRIVGGLIGAGCENQWGVMCATDMFMLSEGGTDLLLKDFKQWATQHGAEFAHITDLCGRKRFHRLLERLGLRQCGFNFVGAL